MKQLPDVMEHFHAEAHKPLEYMLKCDGIPKKILQRYMAKQIWSPTDRNDLLNSLSNMLWTESQDSCLKICKAFGPMTVDLLFRCCQKIEEKEPLPLDSIEQHERMCILLGWLSQFYIPNLDDFCMYYLSTFGAPFKRIKWMNKLSGSKNKKRKKIPAQSLDDILEATWKLINKYPVLLHWSWTWASLIDCLQKEFDLKNGKWFLAKILARLSLLSDKQVPSTENEIKLELSCQPAVFCDKLQDCVTVTVTTQDKISTHTDHAFVSSDLSAFCAPVCGVLLQKAQFTADQDSSICKSLVITSGFKTTLQELALAVGERQAVLLEGPIGCGKTASVEFLASTTGHYGPPYLTKIQLSDDTDSKTLTGTYTCTTVPGEFTWQPGLLVEACKKGYWILLEDIDRAPMDIISLLLPLIESHQLNIPGRSAESNLVSNQFRLFMTRRTNMGASNRNIGMEMISKLVTTLTLCPISAEDTLEIILHHYPTLQKISQKLLTIYELLQNQSLPSQRSPSTRDFLKWCQRIADHLSISDTNDIGSFVAMSAIDCFVASLSSKETKLIMAETICSELNISSDKADYFCNSYKPQIQKTKTSFAVGRANLFCNVSDKLVNMMKRKQPFAETRHSCVLLERVACCVETNEPVLLVGETGVGKTSALQYLAQETGQTLHVVNMSQQSSSSDLLGGYKPAQLQHFVSPIKDSFEKLFKTTFSFNQNQKFLSHIQNCLNHKRYNDLCQLMSHSSKAAIKKIQSTGKDLQLLESWKNFCTDLHDLKLKLKSDSPIAFNFVEGKLSKCIQKGDWILLDEINLAAPDTLECLSSVLESDVGSIMLMERGDAKPVERHNNFRIFAAMNPATDVGKRNLPDGVRNRFTEIYVDEPNNYNDLSIIVGYYMKNRTVSGAGIVDGIVKFYQDVCKLATHKLVDGSGHKPHYSLRTLCRALQFVSDNVEMSLHKALYEGFHLSFLTALNRASQPDVEKLIKKFIVGKSQYKSVQNAVCPKPSYSSVCVGNFYLKLGEYSPMDDPSYIITPSVSKNLQCLARPVSYGKYPILVQGETSTGKTSLIRYLGVLTGNKVIRINNHEHTDLQEYIGSYGSNTDGKLVFQDGPLVTAMREGHWVILDELNLAPTDILEALNRVLDDNREIFITETQEVVRAHPRFQLFATQNPPGLYGGRKILSRAFRNRFIELHFDEIPSDELITILHKRCHLSTNHCKKLVKIMVELQSRRRSSGLFAGKHGYITLRDLFKWAERYRRYEVDDDKFFDWDQYLANDGFLLLAGKVRKKEEEMVIEEVISKHLGRKIKRESLFELDKTASMCSHMKEFSHLVWTEPMRRLYVTLERALRFNEPVLIVGETGGGKTTACQLVSAIYEKKLAIINCHASTEAADFIGGLRPVRSHVGEEDQKEKSLKLFEWIDGPLVESMCSGNHLLVDEISLADDSVLERLNSVLEPERCLVIPDKMSMNLDGDDSLIVAKPGFQFLSTMNPGGDFGKKELSPALRNRLTEIWCDVIHDNEDLTRIVEHNLLITQHGNGAVGLHYPKVYAKLIVDFVNWFKSTSFGKRFVISVRDLLTLAKFVSLSCDKMDLPSCYIHAVCLVYVDGIGSGLSGGFASQSKEARSECLKFLIKQLTECDQFTSLSQTSLSWLQCEMNGSTITPFKTYTDDCLFGMGPFSVEKGKCVIPDDIQFTFDAHTTSHNALRVVRALQLPRPILLEGSPGGGKTSLVTAIAKFSGHHLVRINLSEQTDASDLFGEDLPVEHGLGGEFSWRDGPLLSALKAGHWVVLDELNLASQSVLESLNSVFDHRGEIYIPDLGQTFTVNHDKTRIFACQNPLQEGGGRKGLPKSFLNRFTQVYVRNLTNSDLFLILMKRFPEITSELLHKMIQFNTLVQSQIVVERSWAHLGSPWEFNLRDMTCWCTLVADDVAKGLHEDASKHMYLVYIERLRTDADRKKMENLFFQTFHTHAYQPSANFYITNDFVQFGNVLMNRSKSYFPTMLQYRLLPNMLHSAESLGAALNQNWPCIISGSSGSGKSRLVKMLATLSGQKLRIMSTNSAMDAVELLGGYEQADQTKNILTLLHDIKRHILKSCESFLADVELNSMQCQNLLKVVDELGLCINRVNHVKDQDLIDNALQTLKRLLSSLKTTLQNLDYLQLEVPIDLLEKCIAVISQTQHKGTYEWSDSVLVEALRNGDWLLVDDANFCLPSVLDRLNALLEPDGILGITERGIINGKITEIKPHPNFRLIFALDPVYGELSRAMRNRCIEIHLLKCGEMTLGSSMFSETAMLLNSQSFDSSEESFCQKMVDNIAGNEEISEQSSMLKKGKHLMALYRRGIEISQPMFLQNAEYQVQVQLPTVKEFANNPMLSMILRQLKVFDLLSELTRNSTDSLHTVICCCLQILAENATPNDWKIRCHVFEDFFQSRVTENALHVETFQDYPKMFQRMLELLFADGTFCAMKVSKYLSWDPQTNNQLCCKLAIPVQDFSMLRSCLLSMVQVTLKFDEQASLSSISIAQPKKSHSRKRKRNLENLTCFQAAQAFYENKILLSDLPHPALVSLYTLYEKWCLIAGGLQKLPIDVKSDEMTVLCQRKLMEISFIWRYFMQSTFSLPTFTLYFGCLQSCIKSFVNYVSSNQHESPFSELQNLISEINLVLKSSDANEKKFQTKFRSLFSDCKPFGTEHNFLLQKASKQIIGAILNACKSVFDLEANTSFHWNDIVKLIKTLSCDLSDFEAEKLFEVSKTLCNTKDFNDCLNKIKPLFESHETPLSIRTFGISTLERQVWPLSDFLQVSMMCSMLKTSSFQLNQVCNSNLEVYSCATQGLNSSNSLEKQVVNVLNNFSPRNECGGSQASLGQENDYTFGSANFVPPTLTTSLFPLLLVSDSMYTNSMKIPFDANMLYDQSLHQHTVSVKDFEKKKKQLLVVQQMLWTGAAYFSRFEYSGLHIGPMLNFSVLTLLLNVQKILHTVQQTSFSQMIFEQPEFNSACQKLALNSLEMLQNCPDLNDRFKSVLESIGSFKSLVQHSVSCQSNWVNCIGRQFNIVTNLVVNIFHMLGQLSSADCPEWDKQTKSNLELTELTIIVGKAFVQLGLLCLTLVTPTCTIDPVKKFQTKFECLSDVHNRLKTDLDVRNHYHKMLRNVTIVENDETLLRFCNDQKNIEHPRTEATVKYLNLLVDKLDSLGKKCAFRPNDKKFQQLLSVCKSFASSFVSSSAIQNVLDLLEKQKHMNVQNSCHKLEASLRSFCTRLTQNFPEYPDIIGPILDSINQIIMGLGLVSGSTVIQQTQNCFIEQTGLCVETFVSNLISNQSNNCYHNLITKSIKIEEMSIQLKDKECMFFKHLNIKVLIKLLLDLFHQSFLYNDVTKKNLRTVLQMVAQLWQKDQDAKEKNESDKSSLYKYKPLVHEDDTLDEDAEIQTLFPDFDEEIQDCSSQSEKATETPLLKQLFDITVYVHGYVVRASTKSDLNLDFSLPLLCTQHVAYGVISDMYPKLLGEQLDYEMWRNHIVMLSSLQSSFTASDGGKVNVYKDPMPLEVSKCLAVLTDFQTTVTSKLLCAFPDHPVLTQLVVIIERIICFSVNSPLMKFVHGLELLLETAQEWECNASSELSICLHLEAVTNLILDWRKLELKSWSHLLDDAKLSVSDSTTKWWFYLYGLVNEYLEKKDTMSVVDIITSVQQFIESATIVEFKDRLQLVHTFYCDMKFNGYRAEQLATALNNMYNYYSQFLSAAEDRILALRKPIEKQLNNFIKIAKWNDINFYSVKESIAKTHKTLFKFVKKFKSQLVEPVSTNVLKAHPISFNNLQNKESKGTLICKQWNSAEAVHVDFNHGFTHACNFIRQLVTDENTETEILPRLSTVAKKLSTHSLNLRKTAKSYYSECLMNIEDTTGDIIGNFEVLRKLEPKTPQSNDEEQKKKRLSEAKHIQSRKRKALADLFKLLRSLGVSYRKGLVWKNKNVPTEIMLTSNVLLENSNDPTAFCMSADDYFYRLIATWSAMHATLPSPNKEIGMSNLQRISGLTNHLMMITTKQRETLSNLNHVQSSISNFLQSFEKCYIAGDYTMSNHRTTLENLQNCLHVVSNWLESIKKFKLVVEGCPPKVEQDSIFTHETTYTCYHGDDVWTKTMDLLNNEITFTSNVYGKLYKELLKISVLTENGLKLRHGTFVSESLHQLIQTSILELNNSSLVLWEKLTFTFHPDKTTGNSSNMFCQSPLLLDVAHGRLAITKAVNDLKSNDGDKSQKTNQTQLLKLANQLIHCILLAVQDLKTASILDVEQEKDMLDDQLVNHIFHEPEKEVSNLHTNKVHAKMLHFVEALMTGVHTDSNKLMVKSVLHVVQPFIVEYQVLIQHAVETITLAHRTTTKLAYILSSIFSQLLIKGFCPPADMEEELSDEKGELKEVEDAGIGEGQGAKDVSDQIENEEQVEDAAGGESKGDEDDNDDDDIPAEDNAIEMSEDFEGKMHDPDQGKEDDQDDNDDQSNTEEDIEKQMGDLGDDAEADKLDERMWGSEDEEEEDENKNGMQEEKGAGMDADQSEMAAKDDQIGEDQGEEKRKPNDEEEEVDEQKLGDQSEFDPNERDDFHEEESKDAPEDMEIPDNVNLDGEDNDEEGTEQERNLDENTAMETEEDNIEEQEENEPETEAGDENVEKDVEQLDEENNTNDDMDTPCEEINAEDEIQEDESNEQTQQEPANAQENKDESNSDDKDDENEEENKPAQGTQLPSEENEISETDEKVMDKISKKQAATNENNVQQSENASELVSQESKEEGKDDQKSGNAPSSDQNSESTTDMLSQNASNMEQKDPSAVESERNLGKSDSKRSLADAKEQQVKRVRTVDAADEKETANKKENTEAEMYKHIVDDKNGYDQQALDAATDQQMEEQKPKTNEQAQDETEEDVEPKRNTKDLQDTIAMDTNEGETATTESMARENDTMLDVPNIPQTENVEEAQDNKQRDEDELIQRSLAMSSIHTNLEHWTPCEQFTSFTPEEIQEIRKLMEEQLRDKETVDSLNQKDSERLWQQYLSLTQPLAQQLSEQLRLILEPTQAAKLKGDYRSGRRLNMRKVIPYIASGFRKDKIWLRRSKPSKRAYQVMLAMDDSSSMADNHTKQLAFESLAVISSALSTLEAGQLAVCSFGEDANMLHDFSQPFTDQSGSSILQKCTFQQEQTKIAKLLEANSKFMKSAQMNYMSSADPRISQLLLIISDGRGLYIEGRETVESAVRAARDCGIFIAFVILDNPKMKDSILDIKVPIFKQAGQMPEIRSYMEDFPFPFYVVIRDVNALPDTLSEALRQWFELVTSST